MDRPKWTAARVTDYRHYHLSGDLSQHLQGRVDSRITQFEMASEELKQQLEAEKEASEKLQEEAELMQIKHDLETEKLKQQQWQEAIKQLNAAKEQVLQEHDKCLTQIREISESARAEASSGAASWLSDQMARVNPDPEKDRREQERREAISDLKKQQEEISRKLAELEQPNGAGPVSTPQGTVRAYGEGDKPTQEILMQQIKGILTGRKEEDQNKALLKAFITAQNKAPGEGGTNTLKVSLVNSLLTGEGTNTMADWLANLNRQEESESEISKLPLLGDMEGLPKQGKARSGILDKATTNIQ